MRIFDRKFGVDFLARVPLEPGIYRMYDAAGALLYVGKARNLRRRLAQYRTARRTKKDRKRRQLVNAAARIEWQVCVGIQHDGVETRFCFTTSPEAFAAFELHGAFRSRDVTRDAFFALMRLLRFVGHPTSRRARQRLGLPRHSRVRAFRRLPGDWPERWKALLRGESRAALEQLSLRLLEYDGACARSDAIQADLEAVARFFDDEALTLAQAIRATGYSRYPVPQRERDALFLRYRDLHRTRMTGTGSVTA